MRKGLKWGERGLKLEGEGRQLIERGEAIDKRGLMWGGSE